MTSHGQVRRALPGDRAAVIATVVAAFAEDPGWRFLLNGEHNRVAPLFAGALFDLRCPRQSVWVTDDLLAVAMWDRPAEDGAQSLPVDAIWDRYTAQAGPEVHERLIAYNQAVGAASTPSPYSYLGVLATHPEQRGKGLASTVLQPEIALADEAAIDCCLETSTEANRRFYEKRGFTEAVTVEVLGGPPTWWLRRAARR
jgi:GNAT superfamily N-acetyltransferase